MPAVVYINGHICSPTEARVSVFDRGFLYGDSVYETLRVYGGVPFAFDAHLERLGQSGDLVAFSLPWDSAAVRAAVEETLAAADLGDAYLRIIVTRGSGTLGLDPALAAEPQLVILALPLPELPAAMYLSGHSACLVTVKRNLKQALDPRAKTGNYMNSVLAADQARRRNADEAIMLDFEGRIAEASSANVFAKVGDSWWTPPLEVGILSGITRGTLLRLARDHGVAVEERILWPVDLAAANEVFLCSSVREMVPIVRLDDQPVGDGRVGAGFTELLALYRAEVRAQTSR